MKLKNTKLEGGKRNKTHGRSSRKTDKKIITTKAS